MKLVSPNDSSLKPLKGLETLFDFQEETQGLQGFLSMSDYWNLVQENPERHFRPSFSYLLEALEFVGKDLFFSTHSPLSPAVFGQREVLDQFMQYLKDFEEEGISHKLLLLVGPNGSAKSSFIKKIIKAMEEYSQTEEGALFTFSWVFPLESYVRGNLGLATHSLGKGKTMGSFAFLEDKDLAGVVPSDLKDSPLLLFSSQQRTSFVEDFFKNNPSKLDSLFKSYFLKGDLSARNKAIYEALLKNYKGNHLEVLKHVRIERFYISKRYTSGAVSIEPQMHVDARLQQITADRKIQGLPSSLQSLNLFTFTGELPWANRGILEFSDLLKRPLDAFKYLLSTTENSQVNLSGIPIDLDVIFTGTANELHLTAFRQHPDFASFKGRIHFIRVPYLLNVQEEEKIYEEQIEDLKERCRFARHSIRALCFFSVMTRLRAPYLKQVDMKQLEGKDWGKIVSQIGPLEKAKLYANPHYKIPTLTLEEQQILFAHRENLLQEFKHDSLYEGKFGLSPRDLKEIIYQLSMENEAHFVTFIDVLEKLKKLLDAKGEYDFLSIPTQGDYHNTARFLELIRKECLDLFEQEVRECLGLIDDRSYEEYLKRYIENINALLKNEKKKNPITGKYDSIDTYSLEQFEKNIALKEDPLVFRGHLISKLGAYFLEHPKEKIVYCQVFPELVEKLKESFRQEQRKIIEELSQEMVHYGDKEHSERLTQIVDMLEKKYEYTSSAALALLKELFQDRY